MLPEIAYMDQLDKQSKPGITVQDVLNRINYTGIAKSIPNKEYDFVDFFCGAGGMSYGFHQMANATGRLRWAGAVKRFRRFRKTAGTTFSYFMVFHLPAYGFQKLPC